LLISVVYDRQGEIGENDHALVVLGFGVVPFALLYVLQQIWTVSLDCLFLIAIFLITKMVKFLHDHSHQFPLDGHKRRKLTT
jgi:hypothetical protein